MVQIDIRNVFSSRRVELIEVGEDTVYYAEEKSEEGHNNLFFLEYNRHTSCERVVTTYSLDNLTYMQHIFPFDDSIVLLLENGSNMVWLYQINKQTGEETAKMAVRCIGNFGGCKALSQDCVLLYTVESPEFHALFQEYQKVTGNRRIAYLLDLKQQATYFVKSPLVGRLSWEDYRMYSYEGEKRVLLLDPYGDEAFKYRCYQEARWISKEVCDYIWTMPLAEFIDHLKRGSQELPAKLVLSAGTEGMVRFVAMDGNKLYLKVKHFPSGGERICSYCLSDGKIQVIASLHEPGKAGKYYRLDERNAKMYELTPGGDSVQVKGIVNSSLSASYRPELGDFIGSLDDRYLLCRKTLQEESSVTAYEYYTLLDSKDQSEESFECSCAIFGNTLLLY